MHTMRKSFFTAILMIAGAALFLHCARTYQPNSLPDRQLRFGSSGGFTGETIEYVLLPNGQVFRHDVSSDTYTETGRLSTATAKKYFAQADYLDWDHASGEPGNMNFFLAYYDDDTERRHFSWSTSTSQTPDAFNRLYTELMAEVSRLNTASSSNR